MTAHLQDKPHFVYRCYALNGALLYVGCTHDVKKRLDGHRAVQGRFGWVAITVRVTWEHVGDRDAALVREAEVIRDESPIFNVQGTGKWSPRIGGIREITEHVPAYVPRHAAERAA